MEVSTFTFVIVSLPEREAPTSSMFSSLPLRGTTNIVVLPSAISHIVASSNYYRERPRVDEGGQHLVLGNIFAVRHGRRFRVSKCIQNYPGEIPRNLLTDHDNLTRNTTFNRGQTLGTVHCGGHSVHNNSFLRGLIAGGPHA